MPLFSSCEKMKWLFYSDRALESTRFGPISTYRFGGTAKWFSTRLKICVRKCLIVIHVCKNHHSSTEFGGKKYLKHSNTYTQKTFDLVTSRPTKKKHTFLIGSFAYAIGWRLIKKENEGCFKNIFNTQIVFSLLFAKEKLEKYLGRRKRN